VKRIFITGATGILGSQIVSVMSKINSFEIIALSRFEIENGDELLNTLTRFEKFSDVNLLHCAWPVANPDYRKSVENYKFNLTSQLLVNRFKSVFPNSKIFAIGSYLECGSISQILDGTKPNPQCKYSEQKNDFKEWLEKHYPGHTGWFRLGNMVSGLDPKWKLVGSALQAENEFYLRSPNSRLDYIHRLDAARAVCHLIQILETPNQAVIGTGRSLENLQLVKNLIPYKNIVCNPNATSQVIEIFPKILFDSGWKPNFTSAHSLANKCLNELQM
jgi:nucleoside-diphosphate-sugar epimerase